MSACVHSSTDRQTAVLSVYVVRTYSTHSPQLRRTQQVPVLYTTYNIVSERCIPGMGKSLNYAKKRCTSP